MWVCSFSGYAGLRFELGSASVYEGFDLLNHFVASRAASRLEAPVLVFRQVEAQPLCRLLRRALLRLASDRNSVVMSAPAALERGDLVIR